VKEDFFASILSDLGIEYYDTSKNKFITRLGEAWTSSKVSKLIPFEAIGKLSSIGVQVKSMEEGRSYIMKEAFSTCRKLDPREEKKKEKRDSVLGQVLKLFGENEVRGSQQYWLNLIPIVVPNESKGRSLVFYSPDTHEIENRVSPEGIIQLHGITLQELYMSSPFAVLEFNPYSLEKKRVGDAGKLILNMYKAPYWRTAEFTGTPSIPPFFDKLLNHLFPTEGHKEYVLAWICRAVLGRNNTILTLVGAKGIGKTLLASTVGNLVGKKYYAVVGNSILTEKFNSPMKNNRLLFLDEVVAKNQEELSKLKSYVNKYIPIEEKGVDTETKENFNSIILSCNVDDNIGLQADDRRYSVPDLTDINLMAIMNEDEINEFAQDIEEEESTTLQELGNWILDNGEEYMEKYPDYSPLKSKSFYHIVRSNMALWQIFTEDYLIDSPSQRIAKKDLAKAYERQNREGDSSKIKYPKNSVTIENFLKSHSYLGKYRLARLEKGNPLLNEASNELYFVIDDSLYREVMLPKMSLPEQVVTEKKPIIYINKTDEALDL
jgi:hypothetical protein